MVLRSPDAQRDSDGPPIVVIEEGSEESTVSGGSGMMAAVRHSSRVERRLQEHTRRAELYRRYKAGLMVDDWARPPAGTYNYLVSPKGPTLITGGHSGRFKMVICEAPTHENARAVALYLKNRFGVTDLIRVSSDNDSRYPREAFEDHEITLHDLPFADGGSPPEWVIESFMEILDSSLYNKKRGDANPPCIAIHCISGLGRSPVMVTLGLIEREKMEPIDAVRLVRKLRSSRCFTKEQSAFLCGYTPMYRRTFCMLGCFSLFTRKRSAKVSRGRVLLRGGSCASTASHLLSDVEVKSELRG